MSIHTKSLSTESQNLSTKLDSFVQVTTQHHKKFRTEIEQWKSQELEHLSAHSTEIKDHIAKINKSLQLVVKQEGIASDAAEAIQLAIKDAVTNISTGYASWMVEMKKSSERICEKAETASVSSSLSVRLFHDRVLLDLNGCITG